MAAEALITEHLDLWSSTVKAKSTQGRGSSKKIELYGIKKLRELILELAVRGLLVPQDPSDEPASELLKRIEAEKARLVKSGEIKKSKPLPSIRDDEKLFKLPKGWEWSKFENTYSLEYGNNLPKQKRSETGEYPVFGSNGVVGTHNEYCVNSPCIIIGRKGSAGALNLCLKDACWVTDVAYSTVPPSCLSVEFVFIQFQTLSLDNLGKGIKPGLNRNDVYKLAIALPPLPEQQRIVAKVDELMALCDQLEQQQESSLSAHQTLVQTLLDALTQSSEQEGFQAAWARIAEHFDTLFTTEWSVDQLKQTILQLAVMGKLVQQDPNDEPASELLKRLKIDRDEFLRQTASTNSESKTMIRKLKKLSLPNAPFKVPDSWICIHLLQVSKILVDCHNKTAPYTDSGIPIIRTSNIKERQFVERDLKFVNQKTYDYWSRRCPPEPGDIMFTREAPMGEALIVPQGAKWCLGQRTMLIRPMSEYVSNEFLLLALTEPHLLERASEFAVGLTVKHLRVGDVENLIVPFPPLPEQHRIVAKVDELMTLCDALKERLNSAQHIQVQLADAVAHHALN